MLGMTSMKRTGVASILLHPVTLERGKESKLAADQVAAG